MLQAVSVAFVRVRKMRLSEERKFYPERVKRKLEAYSENYFALLIAILADVTPEEAFLTLGEKHLVKFIDHKKYTTNDIYDMLNMRAQGATLRQIGAKYGLTPKMVAQVIRVYGKERKINE